MNLIQIVLGVTGYRQAKAFDYNCQYPRQTQENLLKRILEINARTAFGKDHHFQDIESVSDYQKKVPFQTYDDLEPYIQASMEGEPAQLTQDPPVLYSTTSGTTGKPKFIPITKSSQRDKSLAMRLWLYHAAMDHPAMFDGQILAVVSPEVEGYTPSGIPYGAESGHAYRSMPYITQSAYAIPYDVFALRNYDAKYYTLMRIAMDRDISFIGTCNPSTIILLARKMAAYQAEIVRDIHDGTLSLQYDLPAEDREKIESLFSPNPERAHHLEELIGKYGTLTPQIVWPKLALLGCWKGGSVGLYLREFKKYFDPDIPIRDWGFLASELRGSIPISDEGCGGILAIETNFYEFIHEDEADQEHPTYLTVEDLVLDERYFVIPTTTGGLYRYDMNDLIKVTGFHERTPIIEFVQKGKGVSSLTGEKLYEVQVCTAVQESRVIIEDGFEFIVITPEWGDPPRYIALVEEKEGPLPDVLWKKWMAFMDASMCRQNEEYDLKRKSQRLGDPRVKIVKSGEFQRYREKKVQEGTPDGQFKILRLNPSLDFQQHFAIDRIIEM